MADDKPTKPYGYIYLISNSVNGKVYVGQTCTTIEERWSAHCRDAKRGRKYPLQEAIRKYGAAAFSVSEVAVAASLLELNSLEIALIEMYRSTHREHGYNVRAGGDSGGKLSAETRQKLRELNLGRPAHNKGKPMPERQRLEMIGRFAKFGHPCLGRRCSDEMKAKIGAANRIHRLGSKRSAESRQKQSATTSAMYAAMTDEQRRALQAHNIGVPRTEEVRKKLSAAHKGKTIPDEVRKKLAAALTGKKLSREHRANISAGLNNHYRGTSK